MGLKIQRNCRVAIDDDLSDAREHVGEMVAKEEGRTASRERAYGNVGRRVGRSGSWIYRLTSGKPVGLSRTTWRRIVNAYAEHCAKLEGEAQAARTRAALLQLQADVFEDYAATGRRERT